MSFGIDSRHLRTRGRQRAKHLQITIEAAVEGALPLHADLTHLARSANLPKATWIRTVPLATRRVGPRQLKASAFFSFMSIDLTEDPLPKVFPGPPPN